MENSSFDRDLDKEKTQLKTQDIMSIVNEVDSAVWNKFPTFKTLAATTKRFVINKRLRSEKSDFSPILVVDDLERLSREIHTSDMMEFLLTSIIEPYGYRYWQC